MPSAHTFTVKPIRELAECFTSSGVWVDPFAGWHSPAAVTNDIQPDAPTTHHLDAVEFLKLLAGQIFDGSIIDPPYSPTQLARSYRSVGRKTNKESMQNGRLLAEVKDLVRDLMRPGGLVITCGWNSNGMGKNRGFAIEEILLVAHGGAANDTIVVVERKL